MDIKVYPSSLLQGNVKVPTSKSQTLRAIYLAMIAKGVSVIKNHLNSDDTEAMLGVVQSFGIKIFKTDTQLVIHSPGLRKLKAPLRCDVKDSGITLRFIAAFSALFHTKITFTGSPSLMRQRSVKDLEHGLKMLGVKVSSNNGLCPFTIQGPLRNRKALVLGHDSQPVSAILWLYSMIDNRYQLQVTRPKEQPWVNLTISWLKQRGVFCQNRFFKKFVIRGKSKISSFIYNVPVDFSSCAFMVAAGLFAGQKITIKGLDFKDPQGDKKILFLLKQAGGNILFSKNSIEVFQTETLDLAKVDMNPFIDALPIMSILSLLSKDKVFLNGAGGARGKESDRIYAMAQNLTRAGIDVEELEEGLRISPGIILGGDLDGFSDHRIAMSSIVLSLKAKSPIIIRGAECIKKTYPSFIEDLKRLGTKIEVL
jgi:3-phosphoshikimate 1-carboxyvinyltransferase